MKHYFVKIYTNRIVRIYHSLIQFLMTVRLYLNSFFRNLHKTNFDTSLSSFWFDCVIQLSALPTLLPSTVCSLCSLCSIRMQILLVWIPFPHKKNWNELKKKHFSLGYYGGKNNYAIYAAEAWLVWKLLDVTLNVADTPRMWMFTY